MTDLWLQVNAFLGEKKPFWPVPLILGIPLAEESITVTPVAARTEVVEPTPTVEAPPAKPAPVPVPAIAAIASAKVVSTEVAVAAGNSAFVHGPMTKEAADGGFCLAAWRPPIAAYIHSPLCLSM